ncbi:MAG: cation:proton antiporter [Chryseosolibacter sp.]
MTHLPHLITDLGLILAVAGITTLIFRKIRQPVVLGYIIAGFLVGPHVSLFPTVMDAAGIKTWSEIGVIFLLFSLGLEFSFRKLVKVGGAASITALVEVVLMIGLGYLAGYVMGWSVMDSIFLGAILSMSSTTIIIRAFDEVGVRTKKFASLVFGILIVEDVVAILLLVLLSTLAVSQQFGGTELLMQMLKLGFFLILWFLAGIFFVPTFLKRTRNLMNDETMLVVCVALCLLMVMLAVEVGFSAALGAFIMGSILAETTQAERIEHLIRSVKDFFAAIFFVSVGMMIDPRVLVEYSFPLTVIILITIFGKFMTTALGALLAGQSLKHAIQAGMSLAQIGEFSFIIASLGVSLNVTSAFLYPIAVAASAVTTFTTPFLIRQSGAFYGFLEAQLPKRWVKIMNRYSSGTQQLSAYSEWRVLLHAYMVHLAIHSVLIVGLIFLSQEFLYPLIRGIIANYFTATVITVVLTLMLMVPFIWALAIRRIARDAYRNLWLNRKLNRGPLIVIELLRIAVAVLHVAFLMNIFFSPSVAFVIAIAAMASAILIFSHKLQLFYEKIEKRFLLNLNEREMQKLPRPEITPWDAHLTDFEIQPEFPLAGKQLQELALRERYGVNIALIERGKLSIIIPDRYERMYPGDRISVIGTDEQLGKIKDLFENPAKDLAESELRDREISLQNLTVTRDSRLYRKSIRKSGLREQARALVVGLERNGERLLNPDSSMMVEENDIIWVVCNKGKLEAYLRGEVMKKSRPANH